MKAHFEQANRQNFYIWNSRRQNAALLFQTTLCDSCTLVFASIDAPTMGWIRFPTYQPGLINQLPLISHQSWMMSWNTAVHYTITLSIFKSSVRMTELYKMAYIASFHLNFVGFELSHPKFFRPSPMSVALRLMIMSKRSYFSVECNKLHALLWHRGVNSACQTSGWIKGRGDALYC